MKFRSLEEHKQYKKDCSKNSYWYRPSQAESWSECHKSPYECYINKEAISIDFDNKPAVVRGRYLHALLEKHIDKEEIGDLDSTSRKEFDTILSSLEKFDELRSLRNNPDYVEYSELPLKFNDELGGTADLVYIKKDCSEGCIIDLKTGFSTKYDIHTNRQLRLYASMLKDEYGLSKVTVIIWLPFMDELLSTEYTTQRLALFEEDLDFRLNIPVEEHEYVKGNHCGSCSAKEYCPFINPFKSYENNKKAVFINRNKLGRGL